tara:strand:+ start:25030 stop:25464 length:435 start_codon:yes stop_codon:yes gene_type:complete
MSYKELKDFDKVKQIKISSGDEILCEIMDITDEELIVRHALQICKIEVDASRSYGMLKPWISFQEQTQELVSLNDMHIVAIATPSEDLIVQFGNAIKGNNSDEDFDVDTWMDRLYNKKESLEVNFSEMLDSDENIISFPSGYKH